MSTSTTTRSASAPTASRCICAISGRAPAEVAEYVQRNINSDMFRRSYGSVFTGDERWRAIKVPADKIYAWDQSRPM